jgi:predicted alpha/beta superfamily hydrolase
VSVIGTFYSPQLHQYRRVWLYLPIGYDGSGSRYPVLYMHDGQSIFDAASSRNFDSTTMSPGEWSVDEVADAKKLPLIVVAIENAGSASRWVDYVPFDTPTRGKGSGKDYLKFIVSTIKPYVDAHFRTRPDREHTYIAGSSLGGLISFYAGLYYPDVFGKVGALSPSFWYAENVLAEVTGSGKKAGARPDYYFYIGGREMSDASAARAGSDRDVPDVMEAVKATGATTVLSVNPDGIHRVKYWRDEMPKFLAWLTQDQ